MPRDQRLSDLLAQANAELDRKVREQGMPASDAGDLEALLCEPFTFPNEDECFLHPLSLKEDIWASTCATKDVQRQATDDPSLRDPTAFNDQVKARTYVYLVIASARRETDPRSGRVFTLADADRLFNSRAYRKPILRAVQIIDRLGSDEETRAGFDAFFEQTIERLNDLCSQSSSPDSVVISRKSLEAFISWLSHIQRRRTLSGVDEAPDLLAVEPQDDAADLFLNGHPETATSEDLVPLN